MPLPREINFKFPLQAHQKYDITEYGELGFSCLIQMTDDCTSNSHFLSYSSVFKKVERMYFLEQWVQKPLTRNQSDRMAKKRISAVSCRAATTVLTDLCK